MLRTEAGTNGLELARELAARLPDVRVVLTSAYHLSERQLERADCGAAASSRSPTTSASSCLPPLKLAAAELRGASGRRAGSGGVDALSALRSSRRLRGERVRADASAVRMAARHARRALRLRAAARAGRAAPTGGARAGAPARRPPRTAPAPSPSPSSPSSSPPGALVVVNDTRVLPARLLGRRTHRRQESRCSSSARLGNIDDGARRGTSERWRASAGVEAAPLRATRHRRRTRSSSSFSGKARRRPPRGGAHDARRTRPWTTRGPTAGQVPLPPYIKREDEPADEERYQTVFARAGAPSRRRPRGCTSRSALLGAARGAAARSRRHAARGPRHVPAGDGRGSRRSPDARRVVRGAARAARAPSRRARERGAPVVAVGTTVVRALESAADPARPGARPRERRGDAPAHPARLRFRVVDGCSRTSTCRVHAARARVRLRGPRARARRVPRRP